ncbi:MAG TPA: hypothetical protein VGK46_04690 [Saprospiraceae bacterium]
MSGLLREINRNRELLHMYEEIGPAGVFGAMFIKRNINDAEKAIAENDVVAMVRAFKELQESK